jgi:hypothetical protein
MRFDPSRAGSLVQELGDPRYAGTEGDANVADLVACRFAEIGLHVERRKLAGSRASLPAAQWAGWLGYGLLLTSSCALVVPDSVLFSILGLIVLNGSFYWLGAVLDGRIRRRSRRPPRESAPVVVGSLPTAPPGSARVIFQAVLGGLRPDVFPPARRVDRLLFLLFLLWFIGLFVFYGCATFRVLSFLAIRFGGSLLSDGVRNQVLGAGTTIARDLLPALVVAIWIGIIGLIFWGIGQARRMRNPAPTDRRGLAVLLEMARTWPRGGSRPIAPVFLVAGGHRLDEADAREDVRRLLQSDAPHGPSLLVVLVEPGAESTLDLFTSDALYADLHALARQAACDLWMPIRKCEMLSSRSFLPFALDHRATVVIGTDPRVTPGEFSDPQSLHRAAQIATEIALRWAKRAKDGTPNTGSPG